MLANPNSISTPPTLAGPVNAKPGSTGPAVSGLVSRASTGPTVSGLALRALAKHPHLVAFKWDGGELSYAGTADLIGRIQSILHQYKLPCQARVALLSGNRAHTWCAQIAAQASGYVTTALHPKGSLGDYVYQLEDAGADVLIVDPLMFHDRGAELAESGKQIVLTLGAANYGIDLLRAAEAVGPAAPRDLADALETAYLAYTGGTSGRPKGILKRHVSASAVCSALLSGFELPKVPRYLAVAPISHVSGTLVLPTLLRGGTVHLLDNFNSSRVLKEIEHQSINLTFMVPTMIYSLLDEPDLSSSNLSSLELVIYGGAPMSPGRLLEGLKRIGPVFSQLYGLAECAPIAALPKADHDKSRPELLSACGFPLATCAVALLDDAGQPVPTGAPGEICVRSMQVMEGYLNRPDETAEAFKDGWLHTGDVARADDEGRLYIVDRKKDMIVTGGFNVYSREVEDVLAGHPSVATVAVIGIPDHRWGESVAAFVVARPGMNVGADELIELVKAAKGPVHAPKMLEFVDTLPLSSLGKVDKKAIRAKYWSGQTRSVS